MFEVHYYFGGFRVCVRWLPIKRIGGASFTNPHVSVAAVFTCAAIRPVNSNPSRNLIPKNEIIWHMQSPPCAMQLRCHNAATRTRPSGRGAVPRISERNYDHWTKAALDPSTGAVTERDDVPAGHIR